MPTSDIPADLFERCLRAIYGAPDDKPTVSALVSWHGHPDGLKAAIAIAFAAGRESALDRDEWRVVHVDPRSSGQPCPSCWSTNETKVEALADLATARSEEGWGELWLEHRRVGDSGWERVED